VIDASRSRGYFFELQPAAKDCIKGKDTEEIRRTFNDNIRVLTEAALNTFGESN